MARLDNESLPEYYQRLLAIPEEKAYDLPEDDYAARDLAIAERARQSVEEKQAARAAAREKAVAKKRAEEEAARKKKEAEDEAVRKKAEKDAEARRKTDEKKRKAEEGDTAGGGKGKVKEDTPAVHRAKRVRVAASEDEVEEKVSGPPKSI